MITLKQEKSAGAHNQGFTLIELSIVLVIIGLIVGGVLVGQDLIKSAETRATITQIEKYNTAVNTFRGKFSAIPGDITAAGASTFGLATRAGVVGQGDGNGLIDGEAAAGSLLQGGGETGLFWVDLSSTAGGNLIDGSFSNTNITGTSTPSPAATQIVQYLPTAKLSGGKNILVYETGGSNYYAIQAVSAIASGAVTGTGTITVIQAYNMDKKMDDGYPSTGNVQANYLTAGAVTASAHATAAPGASTDCYTSDTLAYATSVSNGNGANCGLSFRFQ